MLTTALITVAVAWVLVETAAFIRERIWEARDEAARTSDREARKPRVERNRKWLIDLLS